MDVTAEARARVAQVLSSQGAAAESALETARRLAQGGRAQEGVIFFERQVAANRESLVVAQATLALMFYRGLELHEERMVEHLDRRAEALGVLRYRRQRMLQNRGTVIVIVGDLYARLTMHAVMRLVGVEVSRAPRSR
jgi:hypothetical protein